MKKVYPRLAQGIFGIIHRIPFNAHNIDYEKFDQQEDELLKLAMAEISAPEPQRGLIYAADRGIGYTTDEGLVLNCLISEVKDASGQVVCERLYPIYGDPDGLPPDSVHEVQFLGSLSEDGVESLVYAKCPRSSDAPDSDIATLLNALLESIGKWGTFKKGPTDSWQFVQYEAVLEEADNVLLVFDLIHGGFIDSPDDPIVQAFKAIADNVGQEKDDE